MNSSSHVLWEGFGDIVPENRSRPLFMGSKAECRAYQIGIYELVSESIQSNEWNEFWLVLKPNSGMWEALPAVEVDELAWFTVAQDSDGLPEIVYGTVTEIVEGGGLVDGVTVDSTTVLFKDTVILDSVGNAYSSGSWGWNLEDVNGVVPIGTL